MGDARLWNADEFRASVMAERRMNARIVYGVSFPPAASSPLVAAATSDGAVAIYSHAHEEEEEIRRRVRSQRPLLTLLEHEGPAYDLSTFGDEGNESLASCGDDGRIALWKWKDIYAAVDEGNISRSLKPFTEFRNPQERGSHAALAPVPEANGLAADTQAGKIFSAAGDGCAYSWDMESGKECMVFRGHAGYLQCVASRPSHKQIVTGSEDGTVRMWDCRSGRCTAILEPWNALRLKRGPREALPWISCMAVDASENWMVCGTGARTVTLWSLSMMAAATRITTLAIPQAVNFTQDEINVAGSQPHVSSFSFEGSMVSQVACAPASAFCLDVNPSGMMAVGGYGGLIDIVSAFKSHISTFRC